MSVHDGPLSLAIPLWVGAVHCMLAMITATSGEEDYYQKCWHTGEFVDVSSLIGSQKGGTSFPDRVSYEYDQMRVSLCLLRLLC